MDVVAFGCQALVGNKNAAYFLAKKLNYNYIDCSTETTSPQSIFRLVTKYTVENKNFLPIIGWSNTQSLELRKLHKQQKYTGFSDPNYYNYSVGSKNLDYDLIRINKFQKILLDEHLTNTRWCNLVISLQELLKSYDIDYLMYNVENAIDWNHNTLHMIKHIDRSKYKDNLNIDIFLLEINKSKNGFHNIICTYDDKIVYNIIYPFLKHIDRSKYIGVENPKANIKKYVKKLKHNFYTEDGQKIIANLLKEKLESK